ncbi:MAG: hypothetical protein R6U63_05895 [Longimicrobiales bacterium]
MEQCGSGLFSGAVYPNAQEGDYGLQDAMVWWDLPVLLTEEHGEVRLSDGRPWTGQPDRTNYEGEAEAFFEAREEFAKGEGSLMSDDAEVSARFDYRVVLERIFPLANPRLMSALPKEVSTRVPAVVTVEWHEVEAGIDFTTTVTVETADGLTMAVTYTAAGPLARVDTDPDDPLLHFAGELQYEWGLVDFWEESLDGETHRALHEDSRSDSETRADTRIEVRWY